MTDLPAAPHPPAREGRWWLLLGAAWMACTALSLALCGAGFLHPESYTFLPHYLSARPLLQLIYDNKMTDWGMYQAREGGFLFDWLDARFIAWCAGRGMPHFFSVSHYLMLFAAGLVLWRIATRHLGVERLAAFGLVLLLWSSPSAMLYTSFYRISKTGLLLTALLTLWAWLTAREERAGWRAALFGVVAAGMPMFDKQGLLFLGGLTLFLGRQWAVSRGPGDRRLLIAGLAALVFAWCYQRFLGPAITHHLLGYKGDRSYTSPSLASLFAQPGLLARAAFGAPLMAFDSFRYALGSLPAGIALAGLWWLWRRFSAGARGPWQAGHWFGGWLLFVCGVYAAMLLVFPLLLSNEHRRFYYCLPMAGLWLVLTAAALRRSETPRLATLGIWALVVGSFFALPEHRFVLRHGKYQPFMENAIRVRAALRAPAPDGLTAQMAAQLLPDTPYFRDAVPPSLLQDRVFLTLWPLTPAAHRQP